MILPTIYPWTLQSMFTATIDGAIYARHGTSVDTRLTVIDRIPGTSALRQTGRPRQEPCRTSRSHRGATAAAALSGRQPPASHRRRASRHRRTCRAQRVPKASCLLSGHPSSRAEETEEVSYAPKEAAPAEASFNDRIYEPYDVQTISIAGARPHPTKLVQSAAMASVRAPLPSYRPLLPKRLIAEGILSDAQIETIIYAGDAHAEMLAGTLSRR